MKIAMKPQWKTLPLDECLDSILRGVAPKYVEFSSIAALNQKAIRWGYVDTDALKYHDSNKKLKEEAFIRKGDITLNSTGDITIGRAYFFKREWPNLFADSHVTILRLKQDVLLPDFLIYLLPTPEYQNKIYNLVTGATGQLELNRTNLRKLEVVVPSMPTQRKIAAILSTYDDLIDINRRRIHLLEKAARLLFREWFVYFRFPEYEKAKIVDGVPEGWETKPLREIAMLKYGKALKEDVRVSGSVPVFGSSGIVGTHNKAFALGPAIIVGRKGNVGSVYWSENDFWPIDTVYFVESDNCTLYLYYALLHVRFMSTDVAVPGLNRDFAHSRQILWSEASILRLFEEFVAPLYKQIATIRKTNESLSQARDLLLPRLMSGTIEV